MKYSIGDMVYFKFLKSQMKEINIIINYAVLDANIVEENLFEHIVK